MFRDIETADGPALNAEPGRNIISVIGVNEYTVWPRLNNAVNDALAVRALFMKLGFAEIMGPLLDSSATGAAMQELVKDDLAKLSAYDNLVVFFAGHGHTHVAQFSDASVKTGYLIPSDAQAPGGRVATWIRLDSWLSDIARLPPRHILVILDACRSGVALGTLVKWRNAVPQPTEALALLRARRSRRIITSALDDQLAMDSGPVPGHSLFAGCLLEGLRGGLARNGRSFTTGSELGTYLQQRVSSYPASAQTPDFGALELDDRGDLVLPLLLEPAAEAMTHSPVIPDVMPGRPRWQALALAAAAVLLGSLMVYQAISGVRAPREQPRIPQRREPLAMPDASGPADGTTSLDAIVVDQSSVEHLLAMNPLLRRDNLFVQHHTVTCKEAAQFVASRPDGHLSTVTCGSGGVAQVQMYDEAIAFCSMLGARLPTHDECKTTLSTDLRGLIWSATLDKTDDGASVFICEDKSSGMELARDLRPMNIGVRCVR
jgi:uncharacterized caspase-like protein